MKKGLLFIVGTIVYYFITVLVLYILTSIFNDSFENIWLSAVIITIVAELLQIVFYLWKKRKKSS